jgi:hypothetical protein
MVRIMNECSCGKIISANKLCCRQCGEKILEVYREVLSSGGEGEE